MCNRIMGHFCVAPRLAGIQPDATARRPNDAFYSARSINGIKLPINGRHPVLYRHASRVYCSMDIF